MSERQVVSRKGSAGHPQHGRSFHYYLQKPLNSTILVLMPQTWGAGQKKEAGGRNREGGSSIRIQEGERMPSLPAFITSYMKRKGVDLDPKATSMLADFVGTDLSRLTGELEKTDYNSSKRSDTRHPRTDRT